MFYSLNSYLTFAASCTSCVTDTGSDSGNRSITVIKIDPHHSWCHSSQAKSHELIWLGPVTIAYDDNLTVQSKIITTSKLKDLIITRIKIKLCLWPLYLMAKSYLVLDAFKKCHFIVRATVWEI